MWKVLAREQYFKAWALMGALRREGVKEFLPEQMPRAKG